jgi:hypothetical protein
LFPVLSSSAVGRVGEVGELLSPSIASRVRFENLEVAEMVFVEGKGFSPTSQIAPISAVKGTTVAAVSRSIDAATRTFTNAALRAVVLRSGKLACNV